MSGRPLVFDTMCLTHFCLAERFDVLSDLLAGETCLTTHIVRDEIRKALPTNPEVQHALDAEWLGVSDLSSMREILGLATWMRRIGSARRDRGEASVFTAAELEAGIAITDDREARTVAGAYGLEVHGTLWLLGRACRQGKLTEVSADNILDALIATGMRQPCSGSAFGVFARRHGLF
ncbi:DUF3368 domain-containing protein [Herbidospora mongoliensis]|uniref:DUF3368 domain-containing protein n=1 Tax=Herbidospora mongoliensis TaxID=688067 RepID=UPI00082BBB17|nr:DUF3368 domain-containing protein [Herbidospora mongoliensis]